MSNSPTSYFSESNKKGEVSELKKSLQSAEVQRDATQFKKVIQKVISCMTLGMDLSSLFMDMIKAGATHDLVQKKLVYLYICSYAESNPELALLTVNTMRKDSQDSSAMVRGLALRSMCSLRLPDLVEYIVEPLLAGLGDNSSYVRRCAVMGCVKLYHLIPDFIEDNGIIEKLCRLLADPDVQVVCNCISALDEILAAEGGLPVNQKLAHNLLRRLKAFSGWGQSMIMELLLRYKPVDTDELFDILNLLDDRLKHPNSAVVMACIQLFIHMTKDMEELTEHVYKRVKGPLMTILSSSNSELVYVCLCHIELLLTKMPKLFDQEYRSFFSRHTDPQYIKTKKLEILTTIASVSNVEEVVTELSAHVHDVDIKMSKKSIKAIGEIAMCLSEASEYCIDVLLTFLSWEIEYITSQTLVVIRDLLLKYEKSTIAVLPQMAQCLEIVQDPKGLSAIIWILGEYGQSIPDSPYMLEPLVNKVASEQSAEVKLQLLTATMKLFFKKPPECQDMLGRLLKFCVDEESHMDVHDRALLYYRLLKTNPKEAERVVCGSSYKPVTNLLHLNTSTPSSKEPLFEEFNSLSVIYGQPSDHFISQTIPYIKGRPYTQKEEGDERIPHQQGEIEREEPNRPPLGQQVTVGNLLGEDVGNEQQNEEQEEEDFLELSDHPALTPAQFEQKWKSLPQSSCWEEAMAHLPSTPDELQQHFSENGVALMASSPPGQSVQRYFFYAQQASGQSFFLVEAVIDVTSKQLRIVTKVEDLSLVQQFDTYLRACLEEWIETK
ncbi:AP-4 complex subunit beta-1-like isoform X2 [Oculina patagonica]